MSIYGFATKIATPAPIANDTLVPDFTVYTRKTETGATQLNNRVNPQITDEEWVDIPNRVYVALTSTDPNLTVGKLVAHYASEAKNMDAWIKKYDQARDEARRAMDMIGERLIQESNDRGWCSEFDDLIDQANSNLPGWLQLPERTREFDVSWTETYTLTVHRSICVEAKSADHAISIAQDWEEADDSELRDAISYGNWSYDCDNGDYEATDA